ncbi:hypothetical protein U1Q18_030631 [Sarracenia purpurea var. burkii]
MEAAVHDVVGAGALVMVCCLRLPVRVIGHGGEWHRGRRIHRRRHGCHWFDKTEQYASMVVEGRRLCVDDWCAAVGDGIGAGG